MSNRKPRLIAYTEGEGQSWIKWRSTLGSLPNVHAILFSDGSIWDCYNGWRPRTAWYTQLRIRQIRNLWKRGVEK